MRSIKFPECNVAIGKDQPEYHTLHAVNTKDLHGEMIMVFELTDEEIAQIVKTKQILYSQWTFGKPFQPMKMVTFDEPFSEDTSAEE